MKIKKIFITICKNKGKKNHGSGWKKMYREGAPVREKDSF